MIDILSITLPIYAVVALGYLTVRNGMFEPAHIAAFGRYVLNIAFPALLFTAIATRNVSEMFNLTYLSVYSAGALLTIAIAWVWFSVTGTSTTRRAVAMMGVSCPNSGFVGYPVMLLVFPNLAGQILALNMLVEVFVIIPLCLAVMEGAKADQAVPLLRKTSRVLGGVFKRPLVIAMLAGLLASLSGVEIPEGVMRPLTILASSAAALALFTIGGSLVGVPFRGNRSIAVQIVVGKLILHPAMVAVAFVAASMIGFAPLSVELRTAVILSAAIPMFSIYALFAQELGHEGMASITQIITTVAAFFTISASLYLLM